MTFITLQPLGVFFFIVIWISVPTVSSKCTFTDDRNKGLLAQCRKRRLTRLPREWPAHVISLDVSNNNLTQLTGLDHPDLVGIRTLNVTHNFITTVPEDTFQHVPQLQELDLSDNALLNISHNVFRGLIHLTRLVLRHTGLTELPDTLLSHVPHLVTLDLSQNSLTIVPSPALNHVTNLAYIDLGHNSLSTITNYSLSALRQLQTLSLQNNQLSHLEPEAFSGLHQLLELDLSGNKLQLDHQAYPPGVFSPLVALQTLYLHDNDDSLGGNYPLNVLTLGSLNTLSIDTFIDTQFGPAFSKLTNLTSLRLDANCKMRSLTNKTFTAFKNSSLEELRFNCLLSSIETCTFCQLPHLKVFEMAFISLMKLDTILASFYGLQNHRMSRIAVRGHTGTFSAVAVLDGPNTKFLNSICVKELELTGLFISEIKKKAFLPKGELPTCLEHLDVSGNCIFSWPYSNLLTLMSADLRILKTLRFRYQRTVSKGWRNWRSNHKGPNYHGGLGPRTAVHLTLRSSLQEIDISGGVSNFGYVPRYVIFENSSSLTTLDLSKIGIWNCMTTYFGLTAIQTLDISGNDCTVLSDDMFLYMPTLRRLGLADLRLDEDVIMTNGTRLLRSLALLEHLDLSMNDLHRLPPDILREQPRLEELNIAGNRFQELPTDLSLQTRLSLLDLSNNMLPTLLPTERRLLDNLARNHTLTLRLRGNPLSCTCSSMNFVRWLSLTVIRLDGHNSNTGYDDDYDDNGRDYPCVGEDGSMTSTGVVMADWKRHWRRCIGQTAFWAALVGLLLQLLGLVLTFVISRNWTYVRYAWRVLRHLQLPQRLNFRKDVLLGHADADLEVAVRVRDCLQDEHGVRVLLPYDEIKIGDIWTEKILELVDDSWKILLLVTPELLQDRWSGFLVNHAQRSISDIMPDRVIIVFMEQPARLVQGPPDHPARVSMERLLRMVPETNVFHVHRDIRRDRAVWDKLAQLILHD